MAADTRILTQYVNNDAEFRAWGQAIAATLVAIGMTKVAQTGEINWTTVTRPAGNAVGGFEMYKLPSSGALADIYVKIEYGSGGNTGMPALWYTVGYNPNGAGGFTGNNAGQRSVHNGASGVYAPTAGAVGTCISSCDANHLTFAFQYEPSGAGTSHCSMFQIERLRDVNGTAQDGLYTYAFGATAPNTGQSRVVPATGGVPAAAAADSTHPALTPVQPGGGAPTFGTDVAVCPHTPMLGRLYVSTLLVYRTSDLPGEPVSFNVDHLGVAKPYRGLGISGPQTAKISAGSAAGSSLAIPYY